MSFVVDVDDASVSLPIKHRELQKITQGALKSLERHPQYLRAKQLLGKKPKFLGLKLCLDPEMRVLNHYYRNLDRSTDVLSFPSIELGEADLANLDAYLGDLVMSVDALRRGALKMKHSFEEEFVEVFLHGLLHLLGFDHLQGRRKAVEMFELQRELFSEARSVIKSGYATYKRPRRSSASKSKRTRRKT